ncbi:MAG: hypothetical protein ACI89X_003940 [Planctomycetota bacterium]|jgi:hypothetical protein
MIKEQGSRWTAALVIGLPVAAMASISWSLDCAQDMYASLYNAGVGAPYRLMLAGLLRPAILLVGLVVGVRMAVAREHRLSALCLRIGVRRGLLAGSLISLPTLLLVPLLGEQATVDVELLQEAVTLPITFAFYFGLLLAIPVRLGHCSFWPTTLVAACAFGALALQWDPTSNTYNLTARAMEAATGIWYGWLLRRFAWNLWVVVGAEYVSRIAWRSFGGNASTITSGHLLTFAGAIALGTVVALLMKPEE